MAHLIFIVELEARKTENFPLPFQATAEILVDYHQVIHDILLAYSFPLKSH
jgi:hypothetical protein